VHTLTVPASLSVQSLGGTAADAASSTPAEPSRDDDDDEGAASTKPGGTARANTLHLDEQTYVTVRSEGCEGFFEVRGFVRRLLCSV
jgi:hypothetical protein